MKHINHMDGLITFCGYLLVMALGFVAYFVR